MSPRPCSFAALLALAFSGASPALAGNPFAGEWSGPWQDGKSGQSGEFRLVIGPDGTISGTVTNGGVSGPLVGSVDATGASDHRYSLDGRTVVYAKGKFAWTGASISVDDAFFAPDGRPIGAVSFTMSGTALPQSSGSPAVPDPKGAAVPSLHEAAAARDVPEAWVGPYGCYYRVKGEVRKSSMGGIRILSGTRYRGARTSSPDEMPSDGKVDFRPVDGSHGTVVGEFAFPDGPFGGMTARATKTKAGAVGMTWAVDDAHRLDPGETFCFPEADGG